MRTTGDDDDVDDENDDDDDDDDDDDCDGDGGGERNILMISVKMIMIDGVNDGDDEYLNSYLLGSQT